MSSLNSLECVVAAVLLHEHYISSKQHAREKATRVGKRFVVQAKTGKKRERRKERDKKGEEWKGEERKTIKGRRQGN